MARELSIGANGSAGPGAHGMTHGTDLERKAAADAVAAFADKLSALYPITEDDRLLLADLGARGARILTPGTDISSEGGRSEIVHVILEGHAYRYKLLPDGKRQIIGFLVPGDFCDLYGFLLDRMDHSIAARTACRVLDLTEEDIWTLTSRPMLARALWCSSLVDGAILREWLVNVGRRPADRRVAHILCELLMRLRVVGHADETTFRMILSQGELADTVGLTTVSVNRALQGLRRNGMIQGSGREIVIPDVARLMRFADFDPNYLHFRKGSGKSTEA